MKYYWIVCKIQDKKFLYISGFDKFGNPKHTEYESDALKL